MGECFLVLLLIVRWQRLEKSKIEYEMSSLHIHVVAHKKRPLTIVFSKCLSYRVHFRFSESFYINRNIPFRMINVTVEVISQFTPLS